MTNLKFFTFKRYLLLAALIFITFFSAACGSCSDNKNPNPVGPAPAATATPVPVVILLEDYEADTGNWVDGAPVLMMQQSASFARNGTQSLNFYEPSNGISTPADIFTNGFTVSGQAVSSVFSLYINSGSLALPGVDPLLLRLELDNSVMWTLALTLGTTSATVSLNGGSQGSLAYNTWNDFKISSNGTTVTLYNLNSSPQTITTALYTGGAAASDANDKLYLALGDFLKQWSSGIFLDDLSVTKP